MIKKVFILCCFVVTTLWAGTRWTGQFDSDMGTKLTDSLFITNKFPLALKIDPDHVDFANIYNQFIPGSVRSSMPVVQLLDTSLFQIAYNSWNQDQSGFVADNLYTAPFTFLGANSNLGSRLSVAVRENITLPYGDAGVNAPNCMELSYLDPNNYWVTWGLSGVRGSVRWANSYTNKGNGSWVSLLDTSTYGGYPGMTVVPGTTPQKVVMAYELTKLGSAKRFMVRLLNSSGIVESSDTIQSVTGFDTRSFVVRSNGVDKIGVFWVDGKTLGGPRIYARMYDLQLQLISSGNIAIDTLGIADRGNLNNNLHVRFFDAIAVSNNQFIISFSRGGSSYYRTFDVNTEAVSAAVKLNKGGADSAAYWTSLAQSGKYFAVSYFQRLKSDESMMNARIKVFKKNNLTQLPDTLFFDSVITASRPLKFNIAANPITHAAGLVSIGLDSLGNLLSAYNDSNKVTLSAWGNTSFYRDSANFFSKTLKIDNPLASSPFDTTLDEVLFQSVGFGGDTNTTFKLRWSFDSLFRAAKDTFTLVPSKTGVVNSFYGYRGPFYQYKFTLKSSDKKGTYGLTSPVIDSLRLNWNVKPRKPKIDSIKIGNAPWVAFTSKTYLAMNRRDTIKLRVRGYDYDTPTQLKFKLESSLKGIDSLNAIDGSALPDYGKGWFKETLTILPDSIRVGLQTFLLGTQDEYSTFSKAKDTLVIQWYNDLPRDQIYLSYLNGAGSLVQDTLWQNLSKHWIQVGQSVELKMFSADSNDKSWKVRWSDSKKIVKDSFNLTVPGFLSWSYYPILKPDTNSKVNLPDSLSDLKIDTLTFKIADKNDTNTQKIFFVPNHLPLLDSVMNVGYLQNGKKIDTLLDINRLNDPLNKALRILPFGSTILNLKNHDRDKINGDSSWSEWHLIQIDENGICCTIWPNSKVAQGDTLVIDDRSLDRDTLWVGSKAIVGQDSIRAFYDLPPWLWIKTMDRSGATRYDTLALKYPTADTSVAGQNQINSAIQYLSGSLDMVIGAQKTSDTVIATLTSTGNLPLIINSIKSKKNNQSWLNYSVEWGGAFGNDNLEFVGSRLDSSRFSSKRQISLEKGEKLTLHFYINVSALRGDSIIRDTLEIRTNDFLRSMLRIPIRLVYNDLPTVKILSKSTKSQILDTTQTRYLPMASSLVFAFSEPLKVKDYQSLIKVYSLPDSIARGVPQISPIESEYSGVFYPVPYKKSGKTYAQYTDTLIFTPWYKMPSDSLQVKAPPRSFVQGDSIRVYISNGVTDTTGNPLDLRRNRVRLNVGALDTIISYRIDTLVLKVDTAHLEPKTGDMLNADNEIRIPFTGQLALHNIFANDTIASLDFTHLKANTNKTVRIRTAYHLWQEVDLREVRLCGDSALCIKPMRKFHSGDSVRVSVFSSISDVEGHSLDGNFDKTASFIYTLNDTLDRFEYGFKVSPHEFYVFPVPFRFDKPEHVAMGGVVFKNVNSLHGAEAGKDIEIRIYSSYGDLVYSAKRSHNSLNFYLGNSESKDHLPEWKWPLTNNNGTTVASGVYVWTISSGQKVLKKGKIAVIR